MQPQDPKQGVRRAEFREQYPRASWALSMEASFCAVRKEQHYESATMWGKRPAAEPCKASAIWSVKSKRYTCCRNHGGCSTGPRTPEGLERCRRANWKHGGYAHLDHDGASVFPDKYARDAGLKN